MICSQQRIDHFGICFLLAPVHAFVSFVLIVVNVCIYVLLGIIATDLKTGFRYLNDFLIEHSTTTTNFLIMF